MSFLFNFVPDEDEDTKEKGRSRSTSSSNESEECDQDQRKECVNEKDTQVLEAKEITQYCHNDFASKLETTCMEFGEHCLKVVDTTKVESLLKTEESFKCFAKSKNLLDALSSNSDLVSGVYEGGLKIWECAIDLVQFLASHTVGKAIQIKGKKFLELGCGAGLPGVYCCSCGAKKVDFQDYNEEVLQLLTHTNVHKNISEETVTQCRYFSGDWSSFSQFLQHEKLRYDVILTAETIYSPKNYACLHGVLCEALMDNGIVVLAAKVYYFGVGGSVDGFLEYVKKQKQFTAEIVHTIQAAVPRNIIIFHRKDQAAFLSDS